MSLLREGVPSTRDGNLFISSETVILLLYSTQAILLKKVIQRFQE